MTTFMMPITEPAELREVLADLHYPAEKWEVIACAEIWGVDLDTRRMLYRLPVRTFDSVREVADALVR
jgi:uncharacterized protein DUF2795